MKAQREMPGATKNTGERGEWTRSDWARQASICPCRADSADDQHIGKMVFSARWGVTLPGQCKKNIICSRQLVLATTGPLPSSSTTIWQLYCTSWSIDRSLSYFFPTWDHTPSALYTIGFPLFNLFCEAPPRYIGPRRDNFACLLRDTRLHLCFARTCTHHGLHEVFKHVLADLDAPPAAVRATAAVFQSGRSIGHPTIQECCL